MQDVSQRTLIGSRGPRQPKPPPGAARAAKTGGDARHIGETTTRAERSLEDRKPLETGLADRTGKRMRKRLAANQASRRKDQSQQSLKALAESEPSAVPTRFDQRQNLHQPTAGSHGQARSRLPDSWNGTSPGQTQGVDQVGAGWMVGSGITAARTSSATVFQRPQLPQWLFQAAWRRWQAWQR